MSASNPGSGPGRNFPPFAHDDTYRHKIDPNAAWVKPKPPTERPPTRKLTPWGTSYPIWKRGDLVLVQMKGPGMWHPAVVVGKNIPPALRGITEEEAKKIPPAELAKMTCHYDVVAAPETLLKDMMERTIIPRHLEDRILSNKPCFMLGEKVIVQIPEGGKINPQIGHISYIAGDKIVCDKNNWHIVPRLYLVYLEGLGATGYWTKESITKAEPASTSIEPVPSDFPPPGLPALASD